MIIDYKNKEQAIACGVKDVDCNGEIFFVGKKAYTGITFRNFPNLHLEEATFINCTFEDCGEIAVYEKEMVECVFRNVSSILGHYTDFENCRFENCCSEGPLLTIDSDGSVENCIFENVTASGEDGYIVFSVYGKKSDVREIKNSKFIDWTVGNSDNDIAFCEYYVPFLSRKTKYIDNIDYKTCNIDEGEIIEIGSFSVEE